jgi:glycerol uptake facilitator-like aquaporin
MLVAPSRVRPLLPAEHDSYLPVHSHEKKQVKQYGAEFLGTFWLVLGGCGSAVLAAAFPNVGIGLLGVSLAFGLTVLTMAFWIAPIAGAWLGAVAYRLIASEETEGAAARMRPS